MQKTEVVLATEQMVVAGETLKVLRGGNGPKVLVLHDEWGIDAHEEMWRLLGEQVEIIAPVAPGFEDTDLSLNIKTVRDLALLYSALLDHLSDDPISVIGVSFGAWVAIEMVVMNQHLFDRLILLGPLGLRFGTPDERNFADLFALNESQLAERLYVNPDAARVVTKESPRELAVSWVRNREASAIYGWEPYFHSPGLQRWTEYVTTPVAIVHGAEDRFVMPGYFEKYAASFPNSSLIGIARSGHFPHVDDPQLTFEALKPLLP
ncbi:MAG TPA: alpha/beta hydrolase [Acidimicrobiales bacterium]|nr:alpha/beta hydrolase [Acidimicrobiales bacterium]